MAKMVFVIKLQKDCAITVSCRLPLGTPYDEGEHAGRQVVQSDIGQLLSPEVRLSPDEPERVARQRA